MTQLSLKQKMNLDATLNLNCREASIIAFAIDYACQNGVMYEEELREVLRIMVSTANVIVEEKQPSSYNAPFDFKMKHILTILNGLDFFIPDEYVNEEEIDAIVDKIDNIINPLMVANP